jgi:hypothetical protein
VILRVGGDGSYIEADADGIDYLLNGLRTLRDSEPGTVVSSPSLINGEDPAVGPFSLVRVADPSSESEH